MSWVQLRFDGPCIPALAVIHGSDKSDNSYNLSPLQRVIRDVFAKPP